MEELIAVEERIKGAFVDQAIGFKEIAEDGLYRQAGFDTFEAYAEERANCGASYGWKMVKAGKTVERLKELGFDQKWLPANERQARELARAGEDKVEHAAEVVYEYAEKKNGEAVVTSEAIKDTLIQHKLVTPPRQKDEQQRKAHEDRQRHRRMLNAFASVADLKGEISAQQAYKKYGEDLFTDAYERAVAFLLELEEIRNQ